jgi:serine/threonine-protein kinase
MSTPQQHPLIGQVVAGRYRVDELLGEGGMGAVYIAEHLSLQKQVALKVVHPEHANSSEHAERFAQEAMVTSRIDHPNVISALDYGTLDDGTAFLAVQLVRGPSLTQVLLKEGRLHWARVAEMGAQIADALCAAAAHGIVHRDLKPDNVLFQALDDGGELVKVLDFGVAKVARQSLLPPDAAPKRQITQVGLIVGTPGYMAPEQAIGHNADQRADLYALGVLLWESIVGHRLWGGEDAQALLERQLTQAAPPLREAAFDPDIPEELEALVAELLARRADERPSDPSQVRDRLRELAQLDDDEKRRWRSGARRVPKTISMAISVVQTEPAAAALQDTKATSTPPPSSSRPAWLLTLLVTTILAGAVFLVSTGQLEVRPKGEVAQVAESVAKNLKLSEPVIAAMREAPPPAVEAARTGLPSALEPSFDALIGAKSRKARAGAANELLSHLPPDEVPAYVRRMAHLQLARTCAQKLDELEALAQIGDARALPTLIDLSQRPRTGCGKRRKQDCLECLRKPLARLIADLEGKVARTP